MASGYHVNVGQTSLSVTGLFKPEQDEKMRNPISHQILLQHPTGAAIMPKISCLIYNP